MYTRACTVDYLLTDLPVHNDATSVRLLTINDLDTFSSYRADSALARYQGWEPMSRAEAIIYLDTASAVKRFVNESWIQLGIADRETNCLLGDLGICLNTGDREAEIGFTLSHQAQGKGHARRAVKLVCDLIFSNTTATSVKAVTDTRNVASIRLLEAAEFHKVGEVDAEFKGERCREAIYWFTPSQSDGRPQD